MAEQQKQVALRNDVGEQVITRINQLSETGLQMPKDFHAPTAIRMTMLKLQELKDKNGKPALEVCTKESIANALFRMCLCGLNCGLNQAYPIVRGNQLCIDPSYFGKVLMVKRIFPNWNPKAHVVRECDEFEFEIDKDSGLTKLVKHKTKLENIDNNFVGAYIYMPTASGELDLYVMTAKQIRTAWAKSSSTTQATHKDFDQKMISKTIINSACNMIINSTPSIYADDSFDESQQVTDAEYEVFDEEENKPQPQVSASASEPAPAPTQQTQNEGQPVNVEMPFPPEEPEF